MIKTPVCLKTPLGDEVLELCAGDRVYLSGTIYTARDEAHLEMQKSGIPFNPKGAVIYHCGPVIKDGKVVAAGPTTSARLSNLCGFLIDAGVKAFIGKGGMGENVTEMLHKNGVYLAYTGGCAALAASRMSLKGVFYEELGMAEAVWEIEVNQLPLTVAIDSKGNDLYREVSDRAFEMFKKQQF
ncbi:FumA C-terminus/TtdB family hydratase beta subunit [Methanomicrobium antiquum]|uniref:FumA C-terminus/TtdB family hydratase beta subunit n=1 Tax=Methanomicrobium antiquum TaxID=487686 RepID=A0AAF0FRL7_9EURY|nr:FumA C-terminus/TtdB family hydratase beta subunit [Methanomicrobium antiquum]MDD3976661.1 FumA C-terminus/TtdB family hydratase beta subunit [Methanomicrobium sp.]WFN37277.1 FumA C-terminus/TtdB family hydratase beta subunit [Methanomicrobium antiquum]